MSHKKSARPSDLRGLFRMNPFGAALLPLRDRSVRSSETAFALRLFTRQFARATDGFCLFTGFLDGRLLEMLPKLHFAKYAFALELFLESPKCLIDVVVTNHYLHGCSPPFRC